MAGTMQTEYICDHRTWETFREHLRSAGLYLEQEGTLDTHNLILDVKSRRGGPRGARVAASVQQSEDGQTHIKVEMHWVVKDPGPEPRASFDIAFRIEELLLNSGAVCSYSPVHSVAKK